MSLLHRKSSVRHGVLLDTPRDGDDRCLNCGGICCQSFSDIEISWEEYERLRYRGALRIQLSLVGSHRLIIDGGCEFLENGLCGIYEDRPDICRRFTCRDDGPG